MGKTPGFREQNRVTPYMKEATKDKVTVLIPNPAWLTQSSDRADAGPSFNSFQ